MSLFYVHLSATRRRGKSCSLSTASWQRHAVSCRLAEDSCFPPFTASSGQGSREATHASAAAARPAPGLGRCCVRCCHPLRSPSHCSLAPGQALVTMGELRKLSEKCYKEFADLGARGGGDGEAGGNPSRLSRSPSSFGGGATPTASSASRLSPFHQRATSPRRLSSARPTLSGFPLALLLDLAFLHFLTSPTPRWSPHAALNCTVAPGHP